jgi:hypothetical protein
MRDLVTKYFRGAYKDAASIITKQTERKVSNRSIQAWLIDSDKPSGRRCPTWALKALEDYVASREDEIREHQNRRDHLLLESGSDWAWHDEMLDGTPVEAATNQIEYDKKRKREWEQCNICGLAHKLYELEKKYDEFLVSVSNTVHNLAFNHSTRLFS